jgi:hypothetical protein
VLTVVGFRLLARITDGKRDIEELESLFEGLGCAARDEIQWPE